MSQIIEFQKKHGGNVRLFLVSESGRAWMDLLLKLRGNGPTNLMEHQTAQAYGEILGYERAVRNMLAVCTETPEVPIPQANYGVNPKKEK